MLMLKRLRLRGFSKISLVLFTIGKYYRMTIYVPFVTNFRFNCITLLQQIKNPLSNTTTNDVLNFNPSILVCINLGGYKS